MAVFIDRAIRRGLITASIVATVAVAGHAAPAFALEFGTLTVRSHLNQPLAATVVLNNLDASDRASLDVGIAPPALFQRFGIRRGSVVDRLHIDTQMAQGGARAVVHIATDRPVSEPFVDFLLQVNTGNGRALREYTAMLNPAGASTNAPTQPTRPEIDNVPPSRHAPVSRTSNTHARGNPSSHRVRPGETLWSIAEANTPSGATVAQTMLAIYRANGSAFDGSMSALSQNARLTIPAAATIRAVDRHTAQARLQTTRRHRSGPSSAAADTSEAGRGEEPVASGEAPPASLMHSGAGAASSADAASHSSSLDAAATPSVGTPDTPVHTAPAEPFGRLSLPSDTPWPAPQGDNANPTAAASDASAGVAPSANSTSANRVSRTASDTAPASTSASGTPPQATTGTDAAAPSDDTAPPSDVSQADDGAWLSPRNLLLLVVVLALIGVVLRRLRERGYKPVTLDRADDTPHDSAATPPSATGAATSTTALPAAREAEPTPVPVPTHATAEAERPAAPVAQAVAPARHKPPPEPPLAQGPHASTTDEADEPDTSRPNASSPTSADAAPQPTPRVQPLRFEPADAPEPGDRLFEHRRPATNEEIEALAFETQSLPDTGEREHDRGDRSDPGLEFDADSAPESASSADGAASPSVHRPDPYGLEMIDPGGFDLYDPPSEAAGQSDDDPNDSVEIRLDLARMYIEMDDDAAARELLADVRERGDEQQRDEAERLLERLDA